MSTEYMPHPKLPIAFDRAGNFVCSDRRRRAYTLSNGYQRIMIEGRAYYLHVLILETYVGDRPKGKVARFREGKGLQVDNLYWGDRPWEQP